MGNDFIRLDALSVQITSERYPHSNVAVRRVLFRDGGNTYMIEWPENADPAFAWVSVARDRPPL